MTPVKWKGRCLKNIFWRPQMKNSSNEGWSDTPGKQWAFFSMVMILKDVVSSRIVSGNIDCATWKTVTRPTATALGYQELELPTNDSDAVLEGQEKNLTSNTSELPLQLSACSTSTHHRLKFVHPPRPKQKVMWGKLMEIEKLEIFKQHSQHWILTTVFVSVYSQNWRKVSAHRKLHAWIRMQQILLEVQRCFPKFIGNFCWKTCF